MTSMKPEVPGANYLETLLERLELLLGDFQLSFGHVGRLFGVERVRDTTRHEDVELKPALSLLFLAFLAILPNKQSVTNNSFRLAE